MSLLDPFGRPVRRRPVADNERPADALDALRIDTGEVRAMLVRDSARAVNPDVEPAAQGALVMVRTPTGHVTQVVVAPSPQTVLAREPRGVM